MRLLEPVFGYPFAPRALPISISTPPEKGRVRTDGSIHIDNGSYIGPA